MHINYKFENIFLLIQFFVNRWRQLLQIGRNLNNNKIMLQINYRYRILYF